MLNDLKTCLTLLGRTEIQSLLQVFDTILKHHVYPSRLPDPGENNEELLKLSQYAIDELKFVKIEKNHQPLGLTISRAESGTIHIARIVVGGMAASTELFQIDDRILEINDEPLTGRSLDYVCTLMSNTTGVIKFLLAPPLNANPVSYQTFHVRALYAYDPRHDSLIPCPELGLTFERGDILRIVAYEESRPKIRERTVSWWQAYHEDSEESTTDPTLAGLVPSDSLQQKRADLLKVISDDAESLSNPKSLRKTKLSSTCFTCVSAKQQQRKPLQSVYNNASFIRDVDDKETPTIRRSTNHFSLTDTRQLGEEPSSTIKRRVSDQQQTEKPIDAFRFYERVFRLDLTSKQMTRPIVLLGKDSQLGSIADLSFLSGAPNVGRHELRRRLLQSAPDLFDVAVPHTTRPPRPQESPDIDYHFVSEETFLAKIGTRSFVEFGQYDRDLYGTSLDDVRQVVQNKRKICILNLNPDAIRAFDQSDLYPYVICIAAPSFERLKRLELDRREQLTEKDYREILRQSRSLERHHRLLFDQTIINNDFQRTFLELHDLIIRIQHEHQQWVRVCYQRFSWVIKSLDFLDEHWNRGRPEHIDFSASFLHLTERRKEKETTVIIYTYPCLLIDKSITQLYMQVLEVTLSSSSSSSSTARKKKFEALLD